MTPQPLPDLRKRTDDDPRWCVLCGMAPMPVVCELEDGCVAHPGCVADPVFATLICDLHSWAVCRDCGDHLGRRCVAATIKGETVCNECAPLASDEGEAK